MKLFIILGYLAVVGIFVVFSAIGLFHLRSYSYVGDATGRVGRVYFWASLTLIVLSLIGLIVLL